LNEQEVCRNLRSLERRSQAKPSLLDADGEIVIVEPGCEGEHNQGNEGGQQDEQAKLLSDTDPHFREINDRFADRYKGSVQIMTAAKSGPSRFTRRNRISLDTLLKDSVIIELNYKQNLDCAG
jgi:hypothetical protein